MIDEGLLQLDAEPLSFPTNTSADGHTADRPVHILTDEATSKFLQLETRP